MLCDELVSLPRQELLMARQDCSGSSTTTVERSPIGPARTITLEVPDWQGHVAWPIWSLNRSKQKASQNSLGNCQKEN